MNCKSLCSLMVFVGMLTSAWLHGQVLPADRAYFAAWRGAGRQGEIPAPDKIVNVKDYGAVGDGVANDRAAFNSALNAVKNGGGVVFVPAGTYALDGGLKLESGVVIRGQRSSNTKLVFSHFGYCIYTQGSLSSPTVAITAGGEKGSSVLTVSDTSGFAVGDYVEIEQEMDPAWKHSNWGGFGQMGQIVAIAGNQLTLDKPLRLDYTTRTPRVHRSLPVLNAGVENIKIERLNRSESERKNMHSIDLNRTANSWVRGVERLAECNACNRKMPHVSRRRLSLSDQRSARRGLVGHCDLGGLPQRAGTDGDYGAVGDLHPAATSAMLRLRWRRRTKMMPPRAT